MVNRRPDQRVTKRDPWTNDDQTFALGGGCSTAIEAQQLCCVPEHDGVGRRVDRSKLKKSLCLDG